LKIKAGTLLIKEPFGIKWVDKVSQLQGNDSGFLCNVLPHGGFVRIMPNNKNLIKSKAYSNVERLALKMLFEKSRFAQGVEGRMRSFLVNKNLCLYYWLRKRIGKRLAFWTAMTLEKGILTFGRERVPYVDKNEIE